MISSALTTDILIKPMDLHHARRFHEFSQKGKVNFTSWIPFIGKRNTEEEIRDLIKTTLDKQANGIGYLIDKDYEGQGIAKKACLRLIDFLFLDRGMQKIVFCCDDRNERSIGLAKRLGFVFEGTLNRHSAVNGELANLSHFGLFREEYEKRRNAK